MTEDAIRYDLCPRRTCAGGKRVQKHRKIAENRKSGNSI